METPVSRKRMKMDNHSQAQHKIIRERNRLKTKADKRFEKKVLKVLKEPTPTGRYTQNGYLILRQKEFNKYDICKLDQGDLLNDGFNQAPLFFFTPQQFKDAEAVCFNGKVSKWDSWLYNNEGVAGNLRAQRPVKINASSATFRFKNVSQHKSIVEMYICYGQGGAADTDASTQWNNSIIASQLFKSTGFPSSLTAPITVPGIQRATNIEPFDSHWKVTKIVFKFEPGEEAFHKLKGPHNYIMDGSKKVDDLSRPNDSPPYIKWKQPNEEGCGCVIFFRTINSLSLVTSTAGTKYEGNRQSVSFAPHFWANGDGAQNIGGVLCHFSRHYNIECPPDITALDIQVLNNNFGFPGGVIRDIQIDEDQPNDPPVNPQ
jgi:hypothetical protein